ncbi:MAG TPA: ATP-binding protein [Verrucomicrobiae bacterium]|jgi:signal transduction histidine kinase
MCRETLASFLSLVLFCAADAGRLAAADITQVGQIRQQAAQNPEEFHSLHLRGDVWWANPSQNALVLKDDSGVEELELDFHGAPIHAGQSVILNGRGTIAPSGAGYRIGAIGPVVDNDGVHIMVEKSGSVYLAAGRNPLRVEWFNGVEKYGLRVDYQGPGLPRQTIPSTALFRAVAGADGATNWLPGLDYICAETPGNMLPDFDHSAPLSRGTATNFDLSVIVRSERVGLCFTGFLDVPQAGLYTFYTMSDDGSRLSVGRPALNLTPLGPARLPEPQRLSIGQLWPSNKSGIWAQVEGKADFLSRGAGGFDAELTSRAEHIRIVAADASGLSPNALLNHRIRATGYCQPARTSDGQQTPGILLVSSADDLAVAGEPASPAAALATVPQSGLPLLENASDIHRLKREEAERQYPVRLRGVITSVLPDHQAFTIQDATRGVYVIDYSESLSEPPRIGESLQVEGVTGPGEFAPIVNARRVTRRGLGDLPEPIHPARDQLVNGSLDAQYVELQGILTGAQSNQITLLTPDGRIKIELREAELPARDTKTWEDALVRVRGCLFATWNYLTRQVTVGEIRIYGASMNIEQPAPADLFSTPRKSAAELFLFDPQASVLQRIKISGQILHVRAPDCFLMDGNSGVRFVAKNAESLETGDMVEVVGFPELSSGLPVLREATARKTGRAPLPKPRTLEPNDLARTDLDATWVRIKALLVNQRTTPAGQVLEMSAGLRSFLALLPGNGAALQDVPPGSELELTGVYASQGIGQDATSFGLLLNSPSDISVLARPPWWTLEKLLVMLGALACVLAFSALWITQLRRKVGRRTVELEIQIRERQLAEQRHTLEQERARIARDLHDDLGSGLTEISMLGIRAQSDAAAPAAKGNYLEEMSGKARHMVTALDEIVWAMNPTHDSLESMVSYFSLYAERFLGLAGIGWRLQDSIGAVSYAFDSRHRHQLFLAFKEALTNIVRHSGATEVTLEIKVERGRLFLDITDNGRGWENHGNEAGMDGVANMRSRLAQLGGTFAVSGAASRGTAVRFEMPLRYN